jgi:hypothetical protein
LKPKPKDTAFAIVVTALERSHASRQPEEAFQAAAINKLMELNDPRAYFVLQKLATESPSNKIKELATKHAQDLRKKLAP